MFPVHGDDEWREIDDFLFRPTTDIPSRTTGDRSAVDFELEPFVTRSPPPGGRRAVPTPPVTTGDPRPDRARGGSPVAAPVGDRRPAGGQPVVRTGGAGNKARAHRQPPTARPTRGVDRDQRRAGTVDRAPRDRHIGAPGAPRPVRLAVPDALRREGVLRVIVVVVTAFALGGLAAIATTRNNGGNSMDPAVVAAAAAAPSPAKIANGASTPVGADASEAPSVEPVEPDSSVPDLVEADDAEALSPDCTVAAESMKPGQTGADVQCLQQALDREGFYNGPVNGSYDQATASAVAALQKERKLYVDGVAGRETGKSLDIWPDEAMFVVRTPAPAPGAVDLDGYPLSPVASAGADAPPLPENSGSGRRVVYERISQRAWAVNDEGQIVRSWLVTGSQYNNEMPGTHTVYSRSEQSTAWNGQAILPLMIRYQQTSIGAIGFHGIPRHVSDGSAYQTDAELGTRLSGGCQRQNNMDAQFLWHFAPVGTTVVVI